MQVSKLHCNRIAVNKPDREIVLGTPREQCQGMCEHTSWAGVSSILRKLPVKTGRVELSYDFPVVETGTSLPDLLS